MKLENKVCIICGKVFSPKTIKSNYCCGKCSKKAYQQRLTNKKKEELQRNLIASIPSKQEYISVPDAVVIYSVTRNSLYRLIRNGQISHINLGTRLLRINRSELEKLFLANHSNSTNIKLYNLEAENCYSIGEICKKFTVSQSSVYKHIRQYSIPIRHIGKFVYAPKSEIDELYKNIK